MTRVDDSPSLVSAGGSVLTPLDEALRVRTRAACQGMPYRTLSELTGYSQESIRRYMHGHKPAATFLARICHAFEVSPAWVLLGHDAPVATMATMEKETKPRAVSETDNTPDGLDAHLNAQLNALTAHLAALKRDLDRVVRTVEAPARAAVRTRASATAEKLMKTQEIRPLRLLLGPADGQSVPVEQIERLAEPPGDEITIRLDAKHPSAKLVEPGKALEPAAKVYRYRRVLPRVYRWVDPVNEPD